MLRLIERMSTQMLWLLWFLIFDLPILEPEVLEIGYFFLILNFLCLCQPQCLSNLEGFSETLLSHLSYINYLQDNIRRASRIKKIINFDTYGSFVRYQISASINISIVTTLFRNMLSKQEKLLYGELLRQQIKEREEAKKAHKRQSIPQPQPSPDPTQQHRPTRPSQTPPPPIPKTPQTNPQLLKNPRELQKQLLAKKMESVEYNPFGKIGGGAPNKYLYELHVKQASNPNIKPPEKTSSSTMIIDIERNSSFEYGKPELYNQRLELEVQRKHQPREGEIQKIESYGYNYAQPGNYKRISTPQFLEGAYKNVPFISPQYAPPAPYGYVAEDTRVKYLGKIDLPAQPRLPFQPSLDPIERQQQAEYEALRHQQVLQQYNNRQQEVLLNQVMTDPATKITQNNENTNHSNEIEQEMFKKGGRNLLQFENQVPREVLSKKQEKLKLQLQLKKQIEEAARRKKEEEQKRKEQDEKLERQNREFLQQQKLKYEQELRGKKGQAKNVADTNLAKQAQPADLKKQKFQRIRQQVAKREEQQRRQAALRQDSQKQNKQTKRSPKPVLNQKTPGDLDQVASVISNETQQSRGFNTAISKEFFKKEREKNRIEKFSEEMEKMRKEIANQGYQFHEELDKLQQQAQKAKREKELADQEIMRLKRQLRKKMDTNNKQYLEEIYSGKLKIKDPYYADEVSLQQKDNNILKPRKSQKLILEEYQPPILQVEESNFLGNNSDMMSLIGESKKIPMDITANDTLSISKLGSFAKDTDYFNRQKINQSPLAQRYHPQQSIEELQQQRGESKQSKRTRKPKEELDLLMKSRSQSRGGWGELSSVNEDIVVQIDKMLQNKQRPKSHLSSVGQKTLYTYQKQKQTKTRNDQLNMQHKIASIGAGENSEGTLNSLDMLIKKYL